MHYCIRFEGPDSILSGNSLEIKLLIVSCADVLIYGSTFADSRVSLFMIRD